MTLVDTSIWIETFRRRHALDLEAVVPFDDVVTFLPIVQEVLQGFREEQAFRAAKTAMLALPIVETPIGESLVLDAVGLYRSARRRGLAIRSSVDCLIAACALRHDLEILHRDRDFRTLARISDLRERQP
ncbi:MAG: PIN domain-containing protein [Deltaproteobacteria bacterium]|nr:PIN domain-containing protein [Deltaproteobacteria bacterium]